MRLLVLRNEVPWPLHYGGRLHSYHLCRRLAARNELLLFAERGGEGRDFPGEFECRLMSDEPRGAADVHLDRAERFFGVNAAYVAQALALVRTWRPDAVIGASYSSLSCLSCIRDVPTVWDLGDDEVLHRLRELRGGRLTSKWNDLKCLAALLLYQRRHVRGASAITVLSRADQRACRWSTGHSHVACIPHGVDCSHYAPMPDPQAPDRIAFWGGLEFGPNISAILFFAEKVWPILREQRPALRWSIIGWGDPPQLRHLRGAPGIEFTGYVDDIRPHVGACSVAVVPMVSGAGIKNKIMEAWAMGKPVVCTPVALGDLPGLHGHNVLVGSSPRELALGVLRLLDDAGLRASLGSEGRRTAVQECSWERAAERLETLCIDLARKQASSVERCKCPRWRDDERKEALAHAAS